MNFLAVIFRYGKDAVDTSSSESDDENGFENVSVHANFLHFLMIKFIGFVGCIALFILYLFVLHWSI